MKWYYILGMISYGIFLIQFLLSFIGGDSDLDADLDVDFDGQSDFSFSDLISFKGLIHFLMGLSGWLMVTGSPTPLNIVIGCFVGIGFMFILYYIYKLMLKLHSEPTQKVGKELIGEVVTMYIPCQQPNHYICQVQTGGSTIEIQCYSETPLYAGDRRCITDYKNGVYYIS